MVCIRGPSQSPYAAGLLGELFESGDGVRQSDDRAAQSHLLAASAGTQSSLGNLYTNDPGVVRISVAPASGSPKAAFDGNADAYLIPPPSLRTDSAANPTFGLRESMTKIADELGAEAAASFHVESPRRSHRKNRIGSQNPLDTLAGRQ